ncbi:MAG TPA: exodeoxyribonuclease V subunit gamma [Desulfobacteraceae bacterium]|nr:exodeoxyribonuclease V subunit gamma [Desulfobacteraceae bacterium]
MTGLRLYRSNRLEILAEKLAEVTKDPISSPFDEEIIVVQSRGMDKWVSMQLARRHGIWANFRFPFPNVFFHGLFKKLLPSIPELSYFDPKIMTWRIMKLLPGLIKRKGFESTRDYLKNGVGSLKLFQLSGKIADTFDQYLLFRPEMIFRWERGEEDHWQAVLWRYLVRGKEKEHRAGLGKIFFEAINRASVDIDIFPVRLAVFGISSLPPFYMQVLSGISRFIRVNLFLMDPCREYWGDILSESEIKRTAKKQKDQDLSLEQLHLERGNSLLASMGTLGRDFFDFVNDLDCEVLGFFNNPEEDDMLSCVQSDILYLRDACQRLDGKRLVATDDESIRIHTCHSPMREIEVLQDRILDMFEKTPCLLPGDILVMAPDIEAYAPYIQAVFDMPADDKRRIPFSIADQNVRQESRMIDTFLAILDMPGSRFSASEVMVILESQWVHRRFGLSEADLELVNGWVKETRIRWGIDGKSRTDLGLPSFKENTWKAGLTSLLLGYALPGKGEDMFAGILPYDNIEGDDSLILGKFCEFAEELFSSVKTLGVQHTPEGWYEVLTGILDRFFLPDEATEREMQVLRRAVNELVNMQEIADFHDEIGINVIKWYLLHSLQKKGFGFGFITGGITFCALLPMRSIPFRVICLLGMNYDAYPRQSVPLGFNIMTKHPRPGDRSRRNDDGYLFLEALLSAREKLYISYVGQNIQDNSIIPPSVLVSELMDYIEQGFNPEEGKILDHIVTRHRLQAFSPEYFRKNGELFTYSEENCRAAQCILVDRKLPAPFISKGLSQPDETWKMVSLDDLCMFFGNPARFLLERRLGIYLEQKTIILEGTEGFEIKGLEKYLLEKNMLKRKLSGRDLGDFFSVEKAAGVLPHGTVGKCIYEHLSQGIESFAEKIGYYLKETRLEPLEVDINISGFRLRGRIDFVYPESLIQYRYARVKPKDLLRIWIYHLVLNSVIPKQYPRVSMLAGLDPNTSGDPKWAAWQYCPVENARDILGNLLEKYLDGIIRPLHFFPRSSWAYIEMLLKKNRPEETALHKARNTWTGSDFMTGECEDVSFQLCFANTDPIDSKFKEIAKEIFVPLLEHQKEMRQ